MSRSQLIKFGKMKVQKQLKNKAELKSMISKQAQLRKTLKANKQENRTRNSSVEKSPINRTSWSKPLHTAAVHNSNELQVKDEADELQTDIELRAVDSMVLFPSDPLSITDFSKANPSNNRLHDDSNSEVSEQYCLTQFCQVVTQTSANVPKQRNTRGREKEKIFNPGVVLTDINKLLEKKNESLTMKRLFEKKWTALNTEVSMKDNFFNQIQEITSLKMKLWQRYLKNSGNVYYYEKLRIPILENVRATTQVTVPKNSLTGKCGYFQHCNRVYAFKLFYGRAIEETSPATLSEWITEQLESKVVAACKVNFEKQWTARIPGVAPKDNYFDRIQKLQSLKLNTCERYIKIDGKLYYFEKLQNPLQDRVRSFTVAAPAKETFDGRCGYFRHGRNGLYLFKLIDDNFSNDCITRVINTSRVSTRSTNINVNRTKTSSNRNSDVSRTNRVKQKQRNIKLAAIPCESFFDIFGTNNSEYVDFDIKNNGKFYDSYTLEDPEELCWEIPTTNGDVVRIKAKKKCTNQITCPKMKSQKFLDYDTKSALYDWSLLNVDSPQNVLLSDADDVVSPTSLPRNSNNVILPRKFLLHNVNNVASSQKKTSHSGNNVISPKRILPFNDISPTTPLHRNDNLVSPSTPPCNANVVVLPTTLSLDANDVLPPTTPPRNINNVVSPTTSLPFTTNNVVLPTKSSGTNVLKRVLFVKPRKSLQNDELTNSSRKNCYNSTSIMPALQNENRNCDNNSNTTAKQVYPRAMNGTLLLALDKDVLVVPPLLEGPPCHSVVKVNKTGQQCVVKGRPFDC